jgi:peptide subunit release factor 1 (eRF1)
MLKDLESQIKDENELRHFQEDAEWARRKAEFHIAKGRSLVLFSDVSESFFFEEDLPIRLANQVWFGESPYLRPILEARNEYERYGVVLADREKARFFLISMGEIDEISDIFQEPPVKHRSAAGSDHMRSQMVFQRRAAKWSEDFLKNVSDTLHEIMVEYDIDRVILRGPEEVTAELQRLLPKAVVARVVDRLRMPASAKTSEVFVVAFPIIEKIEREQQSTLVQDLITTAHKSKATGVKAVLGFDATLDAVNQGRVYRLVYPTGLRMNGFHCTSCDVLLDHSPSDGRCPYCSNTLLELEDIVWPASEHALDMGGKIEEIRSSEAISMLAGVGQIGAYLR